MSDSVQHRPIDQQQQMNTGAQHETPVLQQELSFWDRVYNFLPGPFFFPSPDDYDFSSLEPITSTRNVELLSPPPANDEVDIDLTCLFGTDDEEAMPIPASEIPEKDNIEAGIAQAPVITRRAPSLYVPLIDENPELSDSSQENEVEMPEAEESGVAANLYNSVTSGVSALASMVTDAASAAAGFAGKASNAVANGRFDFLGCDVNVAHQAVRKGKSIYRYFTGIETPTPQTVLEESTALRQELDNRRNAIPRVPVDPESIEQPAVAEPVNNPPASVLEAEKALAELEETERTKLLRNVSNFASFRFFHETIMGNKLVNPDGSPIDSMTFYKQFVNASDPNQAFYAQYGFVAGICARILLPIIQWVVSLICSSKADGISGISAIKGKVSAYLQDPENVRKEFREFFGTASDYFYKLELIHKAFAEGDGGNLTLKEYIAKKLDEDLELTGHPRDSLYKGLNNWVVDVINIKTDVPFIGWILDKIISAIMKPVLQDLNIIQSSLENGIGSMHSNPAFDYQIKALIANKLKELTEKLKQMETLPDTEGESNEGFKLTTEEKEILKTLFKRLKTQLPLEGVSEGEDLQNALHPELDPKNAKTMLEHVEGMVVDWDEEIAKNLEGPFNDLFALIYQEFSQTGNRLTLWVEVLKSANGLFENGATTYSANNLQQIHDEAQMRMIELTDTLLDMQFTDEVCKQKRDREEAKTIRMIQHTKAVIQEGSVKLSTIQQELQKANDWDTPIEEVEVRLYQLMDELKEFFSAASNCVTECSKLTNVDPDTQEIFAREMHTLFQQIRQIMVTYDQSLEEVQSIKTYKSMQKSMQQTTAAIHYVEAEEENSVDFSSILPGISHEQVCLTTNAISEAVFNIPESQQAPLQSCIANLNRTRQEIHETNHQLEHHNQSYILIETLGNKLEAIGELHERILTRPNAEAANAIASDIETLKRLSATLQSGRLPSNEFVHAIDQLLGKHQRIIEQAQTYRETESEASDYKDVTAAAAEHLRALREEAIASPQNIKQIAARVKPNLLTIAGTARLERKMNEVQLSNHLTVESINQLIVEIHQVSTDLEQLRGQEIPEFGFEADVAGFVEEVKLNRYSQPQQENLVNKLNTKMEEVQQAFTICEQARKASRTTFGIQMCALNDTIASDIQASREKIAQGNNKLEQALVEINNAEETIQEPFKYSLNPGAQKAAEWEKGRVKERIRKMQSQLYKVVTNPKHIEQLLLRGPLTRLAEENH